VETAAEGGSYLFCGLLPIFFFFFFLSPFHSMQINVLLHVKSDVINHQPAMNYQKQISIVDNVHLHLICDLIYIKSGSVEG
jgi:hypothetical protein